jgi:uncharacterized protein (AIM24 family)
MSSEPSRERPKKDAKPLRYSKEDFLDSLEPETGRDKFDVVSSRMVRIEIDGFVWIKRGTVVAYRGDLKFHRERVLQSEDVHTKSGPVRSTLKREIVPLVKAEGKGYVYVSDDGAHSQVVRLDGGTVYIASPNLLAIEATLAHEVLMVGGVGILAGGIFVIKLSGTGLVAISVKGDPLTMRVTPDNSVSTDPTSTIAWSGSLWPELKTDIEVRTLFAHGGGEAIQMLFRGDGYVVVHARSTLEAMRSNVVKTVTSKIKRLVGL